MEQIVVDANVIVSSFLSTEESQRRSQRYIDALEGGDYVFNLPMMVVIETVAAIGRRAQRNRQALLVRAKKSLADWEGSGGVILYPLERQRMDNSIQVAEQYGLSGADSVVVALAEELNEPLITFDREILDRFQRASL
jgi:predicted nucleic acid-binding protein